MKGTSATTAQMMILMTIMTTKTPKRCRLTTHAMDLNPDIRRSLEAYITRRIQEIPDEIRQSFPRAGKIWKCECEPDFLYGYYVGKIEEGSLRYILKATRSHAGGYLDMFEIRGVIESHREEIHSAVKLAVGRPQQ